MIPIAKPYLTKEEAQAAYDAVMSGWVTQGPRVAELETNFSRRLCIISKTHRCKHELLLASMRGVRSIQEATKNIHYYI